MARIRTIKPEFFTSEDIVSLSAFARLLYIATWCEADKEGRLVWKPATFKLRYFPGDNCDIHALCKEIIDAGLVVLYGEGHAVIPSFKAHQHINPRESESNLPEPSVPTRKARVVTRQPRDSDAQGGREGKGKEGKGTPTVPEAFQKFWDAWPKSERKQDKAKCAAKWAANALDDLLAPILADIETKKRSKKWAEGFIEAPEVYLNNRRWEDGALPDADVIAGEWHETQRGIEARAAELGIPAWNQLEQFPIYKARVMAAHQKGAH